jgi:hypothetical protein
MCVHHWHSLQYDMTEEEYVHMGTSSVSIGIAGLYWSYVMSCIQKETVAAMPRIILLLHVHIWWKGYHLSLVMNGVKVTEDGQVWVPAVCQVVYQVYVGHNPCPEFTNWQLMQCPPLCCCCLFLFNPEANICHWWWTESEWLKKHMYWYQQCVKWCTSWFVLIIIHALHL